MSTLPKEISAIELAKLFGITVPRISQLVSERVLPKAGRGRYPLALCVQAYIEYQKQITRNELNGGESLTAARKELTATKAELARLDLELKTGAVVPVAEVEQSLGMLVDAFRKRMLAMPSKFAQRIIATKSIVEVEGVLRDEVYHALEQIAESRFTSARDDAG
jgi:phage terminase Nu1 subunit (DNA packaging protein)